MGRDRRAPPPLHPALFCPNLARRRHIFTERLPEVAAPSARQMARLTRLIVALAVAVGGEAEARGLAAIGVALPGATLLHALLATTALYLHLTRRGKFRVWADLLEALALRGDERALDIGCGRGAVLTLLAALLPRGLAVGLDLWTADQTGNTPAAARTNLALEGVAQRCRFATGNALALPFPAGSIDLVVSNLAIHNIDHFRPSKRGCRTAIAEAARVLQPGGRLIIADLGLTPRYARWLRELGMHDVQQRKLGWRCWYAPGLGVDLVTAIKPEAP